MKVFYDLPNQIVGEKVEVDDPVVAKKRSEIVAARLSEGPPSLTDVLTEAYLDSVREMIEVRRDYPRRKHYYAINVKVHSLGLTREQRDFICDNWEEMMDLFWGAYILPWMNLREKDGEPDVYQAGRSGGWLVLDRPVVGDPQRDRYATHWPEFHEARAAYRDVKNFLGGWNSVFRDIRNRLEGIMGERGVE